MTELFAVHVPGISSDATAYPSYVRHGDIAHISGQVSFDDNGGVVGVGDVAKQTDVAIDRLERVLLHAGSRLAQVISATVYLKSASDGEAFNAVWRRRFADHRPARATVVADLLDERLLVEISAIAAVDNEAAE
jgi:2-iminobutanoate/2-iminopropanoate deaminase